MGDVMEMVVVVAIISVGVVLVAVRMIDDIIIVGSVYCGGSNGGDSGFNGRS